MASESDMIQLRNNNTNYDIANNFSPAASDALGWSFYGRYDLVNAGGLDHYGFELYAGLSGHPAPDWQFFWYGTLPGNNSLLDYIPDSSYGAWATKVVPIPGAVWLFGSGLLGLIGIARKSAA